MMVWGFTRLGFGTTLRAETSHYEVHGPEEGIAGFALGDDFLELASFGDFHVFDETAKLRLMILPPNQRGKPATLTL